MYGTREYYDKTAADWAEQGYGDDGYLVCLREFLAMLPPGGRVLDLCCGAGYESGRIRAQGFDVVGIDFSGESLRIARERNPDIPFHQQDMLEDYSHIGPVDGLCLIAGLVHIDTPDLPLAFRQMAKVLRPGGHVLLSIREGWGKLAEWSYREIDGEAYDRNFIAHTLTELTEASSGLFAYQCELSTDMPIWHYYVFQRETKYENERDHLQTILFGQYPLCHPGETRHCGPGVEAGDGQGSLSPAHPRRTGAGRPGMEDTSEPPGGRL